MTDFEWLQEWYISHCDGDWEHAFGLSLTTLDNPGWGLSIDLDGTKLEDLPFNNIKREISESDWMHCFVRDNKFEAAGDPLKLTQMIRVFRDWATSI